MLKTNNNNIIAFYVNLWYNFYVKYRREVYRMYTDIPTSESFRNDVLFVQKHTERIINAFNEALKNGQMAFDVQGEFKKDILRPILNDLDGKGFLITFTDEGIHVSVKE